MRRWNSEYWAGKAKPTLIWVILYFRIYFSNISNSDTHGGWFWCWFSCSTRKEQIPSGFVLQGPVGGDGQERGHRAHLSFTTEPRFELLTFLERTNSPLWNLEYRWPDWLTRESAEWWANLNWNEVWGEPVGQPRNMFTLELEEWGGTELRSHCKVGMSRCPSEWFPRLAKNTSQQ